MNKLYCYHVAPIDYWAGALTEAQIMAAIEEYNEPDKHEKIKELKRRASEAFLTIGWEGDQTGGAFYFGVPSNRDMRLGYIVKQSNNGACFIASPILLTGAGLSIFKETTA